MKNKILVGLSILLLTTSCNNDNFFSSNKNIVTNIEAFNLDKIDSKLPAIPSLPIYSVFNNAYKMLADDNEKIARKDPRNSDKYFYALLNSAQSTLDLAFFDIGEPAAVEAFISAHKRGVKVRVVTDTDNTKDSENPSLIRATIQALRDAGIPVVEDKRSSFMHHKFMIIDNKIVWMGSTNPTPNSMYHHNNNAMMLQSPELAENYNMKFKRMFEQLEFGGPTPSAPNKIVNINGAEVATYFSPKGGGKDAIVAALQGAKKSIKFMAFSFTHKDIADVMIQKKKQGLLVEGLFDECLVSQSSSTEPRLLQTMVKMAIKHCYITKLLSLIMMY